MARVPLVTSVNDVIWMDKTIQANVFADAPNPHRKPLGSDPAWNPLVTDYLSQTDTGQQSIVGPISSLLIRNLSVAPNEFFQFDPTVPSLTGNYDEIDLIGEIDFLLVQPRINGTPSVLLPFLSWFPSNDGRGAGGIRLGYAGGGVDSASLNGDIVLLQERINGITLQNYLGGATVGPITLNGRTSIASIRNNMVAKSANFSLGANDYGALVTTGASTITCALPAANTTPTGQELWIKKVDSGSGVVLINRSGTDTIEGKTSIRLIKQYEDLVIVADGTSTWYRKKPLINDVILINADETQANLTVPNADTNLKTFSLPANTYSSIITEAEGYVQTTVLSTLQNINIKVKYGVAQKGNTMVFDASAAAVADDPFPIKASALQTGAITIAVTIGAAAADVNTTVFLNSLRVYGVI